MAYNDATTSNGVTYEYRVRTLSAAGNSAWSLVVAATAGGGTGPLPGVAAGFDGWMQSVAVASEKDLGAAADADRDGLPNLVEYALGSPADRASETAPVSGLAEIGGQQYLTLTFQRRLDVTDVILIVEASDSPGGPWTTIDPLQPDNQIAVLRDYPRHGSSNAYRQRYRSHS